VLRNPNEKYADRTDKVVMAIHHALFYTNWSSILLKTFGIALLIAAFGGLLMFSGMHLSRVESATIPAVTRAELLPGNTSIRLTGYELSREVFPGLRINGRMARNPRMASEGVIICDLPPDLAPGPVNIEIQTLTGRSVLARAFTISEPEIPELPAPPGEPEASPSGLRPAAPDASAPSVS